MKRQRSVHGNVLSPLMLQKAFSPFLSRPLPQTAQPSEPPSQDLGEEALRSGGCKEAKLQGHLQHPPQASLKQLNHNQTGQI